MSSSVLVTGGTGRLGRLVVARLLAAGAVVRVLARHRRDTAPGVSFYVADLRTGEGVEPAVRDVATIVHCASSSKGDAEATRHLLSAASTTGAPHVLYVSIVGIEHIATWGYPKAKLAAERLVQDSGLPWTVLRVTQFYDYILDNARKLSRFPVAPVPAGFRVQPVDADDVAARLVQLALDEPAGRTPDLAGPQQSDWAALLRSYLRATHRHRIVLPVRIPGTRAVRNGALLPAPGHATGATTWDEYLTARLRRSAVVD